MKDARLFIGGEWLTSQAQFPVLDKFTREPVALAHVADEGLVEEAVSAAKTVFEHVGNPDPGPLRHPDEGCRCA